MSLIHPGTKQLDVKQNASTAHKFLPMALLLAMVAAYVMLDAVLPLQNLRLIDPLLGQLGAWPLWPTHLLFPKFPVIQMKPDKTVPFGIVAIRSWKETGLLYAAFLLVFLLYLLALRKLPRMITWRYIFISTLILGTLCILIPAMTSQDIYSYIIYARLWVIYHLNPLTTLPIRVQTDPVYYHLYWTKQPSIYGPTWVLITSFFQWLILRSGLPNILSMVLLLRMIGLAAQLGSTYLVWLISGSLQHLSDAISPQKRVLATLAFAWNPLLLVEACVNGHVDATMLFFVLLALWFLVRSGRVADRPWSLAGATFLAAAMFGIATCLKINVMLFAPGLLLFLWTQSHRLGRLITFTCAYIVTIVLLYLPFWQGGAALWAIGDSPASQRDINTLPDFLSRFYNAIVVYLGQPAVGPQADSPPEYVTHIVSMAIFVVILALFFWRTIREPERINTVPKLVRWLTEVWLIYCAIGSPWFWPWYTVTFFGLFALIEAMTKREVWSLGFLRMPLAVRLFAFSMVSIYCFYSWAPLHVIAPGLPNFLWTNFRGVYAWLLPLLAIPWWLRFHAVSSIRIGKPGKTRWREALIK